MRGPAFVVAMIAAGVLVLRRRRLALRDDEDLWGRATTVPDLR